MATDTRTAPNTDTKSTDPKKYEPRDPSFYPYAAGAFTAALRPRGKFPEDVANAKRLGHTLARLLDRGVVPDKFTLPDTARILSIIDRRDQLDAIEKGRPMAGQRYAATMTEGDKARERKALADLGPVPSREEAMGEHAKRLEQLADISEGVRMSAFLQAVIRLTAIPDVTGAPMCEADALAIVVEELEIAIENHRDAGNPLRSLEHEEPGKNPALHVAYPGSTVIELMLAKAEADALEEAAAAAASAAKPQEPGA